MTPTPGGSSSELSDWAENLDSLGPGVRIASGDDAAANGRATLEAALGGARGVERSIRGRRLLAGTSSQARRGHPSPQRSFRLPEELDDELTRATLAQGRRPSDIIRDALAEYFERHGE